MAPAASVGGKTLVLSGTAGPRTEALKEKMRLDADFVTQAPAALNGYSLIILTDNETAPSADFAPKLRTWVNNGGTLVVQNVTPPLQKWLEGTLGLQFTRNRMEAVRAHKTAYDPLLQGISDGDLAWRGHSENGRFSTVGQATTTSFVKKFFPKERKH
jgi:hypothetical protein